MNRTVAIFATAALALLLGAGSAAALLAALIFAGGFGNPAGLFLVVLPVLLLNLWAALSAFILHLVWGRRVSLLAWTYKAVAVGFGVALIIVLAESVVPEFGNEDWVQLLLMAFGKPILYWLAMVVGDEDMPPLAAAAAVSCVGVIHAGAGIGSLFVFWPPEWIWDEPIQLGVKATLISFFDPLYIMLPVVLYLLGIYQPLRDDEDDTPLLPVAVDD